MRVNTLSHANVPEAGRIRLSSLFFISLALVLLFSVVYIRHLCIKTGYEISNLTDKMEKAEVQYLSLLDKRSKEYQIENLYRKGKEAGMVIPDVKRTFYVK